MKEIQLTRGRVALVDDEDFEYLSQFTWYAMKSRPSDRPVRTAKVNGSRWLPRFLYHDVADRMGMKYVTVDHINGNPLDNRRSNLRAATHSQNLHNRGKPGHNTSGIKGVSFDKRTGRFDARVMVKRKQYWLGRFDTPAEAGLAVSQKRRELVGEFACD